MKREKRRERERERERAGPGPHSSRPDIPCFVLHIVQKVFVLQVRLGGLMWYINVIYFV